MNFGQSLMQLKNRAAIRRENKIEPETEPEPEPEWLLFPSFGFVFYHYFYFPQLSAGNYAIHLNSMAKYNSTYEVWTC